MTRLRHPHRPDEALIPVATTRRPLPVPGEALLTPPAAMSARYPAPDTSLTSRARLALDELRATDEIPTFPIAVTDWSARLDEEWAHVTAHINHWATHVSHVIAGEALAEYRVWDRLVEAADAALCDIGDLAPFAAELAEYNRDAEFAHDAADEARWAEENAATQYDDAHYNTDDEQDDDEGGAL